MNTRTFFFGAAALTALMAATSATAEKITIGLASEPTSIDPHFHNLGPNNAMSVHIFDRLIQQVAERGITVLLVEHDMKLVMNISERIYVMEYGKKIAQGSPQEIRSNPKVIEAYLGEGGDDA